LRLTPVVFKTGQKIEHPGKPGTPRTGDTLSQQITITSEPTLSLVYRFRQFKP
jgi:hypothetical protein